MSSGRKANLRLRDLPFLPLLLVLHVFFTVSSLFLRVYELLTRPEDDISPPKNTIPPRHVGISFASSLSSPRTASSYKIYLGGEAAALRRSIRSAVTWAGEEGIDRLSFYEHTGLLHEMEDEILQDLLPRPLSPPSSTETSPAPRARLPRGDGESNRNVRTLSVFPSPSTTSASRRGSSSRSSPFRGKEGEKLHEVRSRPITIHLIPPAHDLLPSITRQVLEEGLPSSEITQELLNSGIEEKLQCPPPDLLLIHPLHLPSFPRSLLPRPAPELRGYPFWSLRITEIYQHPPPLPLSLLQPVLNLARRSTMPLIRKFGNLLPEPDGEFDGEGALERYEWEGAMRAWSEVEQRLGR